MSGPSRPNAAGVIWLVEQTHQYEEATEVVFASRDGEVAATIARALSAQNPSAAFTPVSVPLVDDVATALAERLTLRQTPAVGDVVLEASETRLSEWVFDPRFVHVDVKDISTPTHIAVTGHDHALVRGMYAALVENSQQKESSR